jgi:hypothetical protein
VSKLSRAWERFWFAPQSPVDLAVCRIVFFGLCFYAFAQRDYVGFGSFPVSFHKPAWVFERLHLPILSDALLGPLSLLWMASLAAACVGLLTRPATLLATAGALYFGGLPFNFGKIDHNVGAVIFVMGIFAISRCGDALSLDALLRQRLGRGPAGMPAPSGEYRWPIRLAWCVMSLIFFAAGATKLLTSGAAWVFSENFQILLAQRHYTNTPMLDWGLRIAAVKWLAWIMAAGSILTELLFPLALFDRRARVIFPVTMFAMQIGIGVFMEVWFGPFMYTYVMWVPWSAIAWRLGAPGAARGGTDRGSGVAKTLAA